MKPAIKILCVIMAIFTALSLAACGEAEIKTFSDSGISITLDDSFKKKAIEGRTLCYENKDVIVVVTKEPFSLFTDGSISQYSSLSEYTALVVANNRLTVTPEAKDNYEYFTYEREVETEAFCFSKKQSITYLAVTYKSETAFWLVQFACKSDEFKDREADFFLYADSVQFA